MSKPYTIIIRYTCPTSETVKLVHLTFLFMSFLAQKGTQNILLRYPRHTILTYVPTFKNPVSVPGSKLNTLSAKVLT